MIPHKNHCITCPCESLPIFTKGQVITIRLPNGYGSVAKLSGQRRRPYIIKKTRGWDDRGYPVIEIVGYAATREEGLSLLAQYNNDPWDVDKVKLTLQQLFDLWKEKKAPKLGESIPYIGLQILQAACR